MIITQTRQSGRTWLRSSVNLGLLLSLSCSIVLTACSWTHAGTTPTLAIQRDSTSKEQAVLQIQTAAQTLQLSRSQLLASPEVKTIVLESDVAYGGRRTYRALPLQVFYPDLPALNLQFTALDGFVATLPASVFNTSARPWLAIEDVAAPWPALAAGKPSAGPVYLVWQDPEHQVSSEQWPYQIAKISLTQTLEQRYPQLMPRASGMQQTQALRGMQVYTKNCAACHSMNGGGDARLGPDLNLPHSPVEYFQEGMLRQLIRNPASVRSWPASAMPGFNLQSLSAQELDDLLLYFRQMAQQRE
ncbi:cytochrome c [Undibacterium rugosum]|uniref:cytochrome c n=1 Tax=Undibacterium rugosum TaxID=2762291 RepID=UPI001B83B9D9|nr:cytochrome c [Undibacterium rugosum]MBR7780174.1 cytochrome c [Undibacterium rugosum]